MECYSSFETPLRNRAVRILPIHGTASNTHMKSIIAYVAKRRCDIFSGIGNVKDLVYKVGMGNISIS